MTDSVTEYRKRFHELTQQPIESQLEFFLKRYIFVLGDDWKETANLATRFERYIDQKNTTDLNVTEASDFLQKNGKTRTAQERGTELKDIDLDNNGRICFLEYLLLHYKVLVLKDYFNKVGKPIPDNMDLSKDGVGVFGVGSIILSALFMFGNPVDPQIEQAIEDVMKDRKARETKMVVLQTTVSDTSKTQVQRMKAQHELIKIEHEDTTGADVALISLLAKRRKVERKALIASEENKKALDEEKKKKDMEVQNKQKASKSKLGSLVSAFTQQAKEKTDSTKFIGKASDRASIKAINAKGLNLYSAASRKQV